MNNQKLLTISEAARALNIKAGTLRKWDKEGKIKPIRLGTRGDRRYRESELLEFIENSQKPKIQWQEYIRSGVSYHHIDPVIKALTKGLTKYFERGVNYLMTYFEGDTLYWYYDMKDLYETGRDIVDKLTDSKKFEDKFFSLWDEKTQEVFDFICQNSPENISKVSDEQLVSIYKTYARLTSEWYSLAISIDATDETLMIDITEKIKKILKDKLDKEYQEKLFVEAYGILTSPDSLSYINNERKMILEIAQGLKAGIFNENDSEFTQRLEEVVKKFWWTDLGWVRGKSKTITDVGNKVNEIINSDTDIEKELLRMKKYKDEISLEKNRLELEYNFKKDKELSAWLDLLERLVEYHDFRKEVQVKGAFWDYGLLDEISKRKNISSQLLGWCTLEEIINLMEKDEFDEGEMNQRSAKFLFLSINGQTEKYSGKIASEKYEKILNFKTESIRDLQGMSASGGKAVGEAFVAITLASASKIKPGQILITGMTTPDFVPYMRKAQAIVTDEGGITCHAAIISRELGIPCIVGTKMATRMIKTGDRVEVAANHGTVRILDK